MTTPRRRPARSARHSDSTVKRIRTDQIRYPGVDLYSVEPRASQTQGPDARRLRPARDAGLALSGRQAREQRREQRMRRQRIAMTVALVSVVAAMLVGWRATSDKRAAADPLAETTGTITPAPPTWVRASAPPEGTAVMRALAPAEDPTPFFASYRSMQLRLPVSVENLTEVGFHQASYTYALHMSTSLDDADMKQAKKDKSTHRDKANQEDGPTATLNGTVLRMWRNRPGKPDSAVDVGAPAGTDVYSPVSGTVVKVKAYKLYGRYDDYEIHIQPKGFPEIDAVMIHVDDVTVKPGDEVIAGVTRMAAVRHLSDRVHHQLGDYTTGGGDHVHFQLNNAKDSRYKGLKGAIAVGGS